MTIEDGLIATKNSGIRGFASVVSSACQGFNVPLDHIGIVDPRIAPSEGHLETWEHFGITTSALIDSITRI